MGHFIAGINHSELRTSLYLLFYIKTLKHTSEARIFTVRRKFTLPLVKYPHWCKQTIYCSFQYYTQIGQTMPGMLMKTPGVVDLSGAIV